MPETQSGEGWGGKGTVRGPLKIFGSGGGKERIHKRGELIKSSYKRGSEKATHNV